MVELDEALGDQERVVVGQGGDAGAEADGAGALCGGGDDQLGRGDDLPAGGMVLADPGFIVAEVVEVLDEFDVAADGKVGVVADAVERREKNAEIHAALLHVAPPFVTRERGPGGRRPQASNARRVCDRGTDQSSA